MRHEGPVHRAVLHYLRLRFPGAAIHHSPNERELRGRAGLIAAVRASSLGTVTGWPDIEVLWRGRFLAFEVKSPRGRVSDAQRTVGAAIQANGGYWAVVRSVDDVAAALDRWGIAGGRPDERSRGGLG